MHGILANEILFQKSFDHDFAFLKYISNGQHLVIHAKVWFDASPATFFHECSKLFPIWQLIPTSSHRELNYFGSKFRRHFGQFLGTFDFFIKFDPASNFWFNLFKHLIQFPFGLFVIIGDKNCLLGRKNYRFFPTFCRNFHFLIQNGLFVFLVKFLLISWSGQVFQILVQSLWFLIFMSYWDFWHLSENFQKTNAKNRLILILIFTNFGDNLNLKNCFHFSPNTRYFQNLLIPNTQNFHYLSNLDTVLQRISDISH